MPESIIAESRFRIVTPMFLGGADNSKAASHIRPPSFKGALRFWWRALNWSRYRLQAADDAQALRALHKEEARLFGAAARHEKGVSQGGQGRFLLRIHHDPLQTLDLGELLYNTYPGARYLGYGLMAAFASKKSNIEAGQLQRGCIQHGQSFTARLVFRGEPDASVLQALKCLGLLGGLGSRARRGYGSLALESLHINGKDSGWRPPGDVQAYKAAIHGILPETPVTQTPPLSAFFASTAIHHLVEGEKESETLNALGKAFAQYRGWGNKGKVLNQPAERRFRDDHDWFRVSGWRQHKEHKGFHPQRAVFGLPHNYGKHASDHVTAEHSERRASPLLFHVHPLGLGGFAGIATFIPSQFLPEGEKIKAGASTVEPKIDWQIIRDFLAGKTNTDNNRFPGREVLWP